MPDAIEADDPLAAGDPEPPAHLPDGLFRGMLTHIRYVRPEFKERLSEIYEASFRGRRADFNLFVCDELMAQAQSPSQTLLLKVGGRGSTADVADDVRAWHERTARLLYGNQPKVDAQLRSDCNALVERMFSLCHAQATEPFRLAREHADQERQALVRQLDEARAERDTLREEGAALRDTVADLQAQLAQRTQDLAQARAAQDREASEHAVATARAAQEHAQQMSAQRDQLARTTLAAAAKFEEVAAEHAREKATFTDRIAHLERQVDQALRDAGLKVEEARQAAERSIEKARADARADAQVLVQKAEQRADAAEKLAAAADQREARARDEAAEARALAKSDRERLEQVSAALLEAQQGKRKPPAKGR
jgi:hypothetical protein